jgi:hypothetical protein
MTGGASFLTPSRSGWVRFRFEVRPKPIGIETMTGWLQPCLMGISAHRHWARNGVRSSEFASECPAPGEGGVCGRGLRPVEPRLPHRLEVIG